MVFISALQLAQIRSLDEQAMPDRADIVSKTRVKSAGGYSVTTTTQSNVPCRRDPNMAGNVETQFGGQLRSGLQWQFYFPYDTVINNDDEIVMGDERFAVMGTLGPRSWETTRSVIAVEIRNG